MESGKETTPTVHNGTMASNVSVLSFGAIEIDSEG